MQFENIRRALDRTEFDAARAVLKKEQPETAEDIEKLVEYVTHSGCLVLKYPSSAIAIGRDAFLDDFLQLVKDYGNATERIELSRVILRIPILERIYAAILEGLANSVIGQLSPSVQAWAAINRTSETSAIVHQRVVERLGKTHNIGELSSLKIPSLGSLNEKSIDIDADAALITLENALFATMKMLAYRERWFKDRKLVLPRPVPVNEDLVFQSGANSLLAWVWLAVENADEQLRYFGGTLVQEPFKGDSKETEGRSAAKFSLNFKLRLYELIAHHRLERLSLEFALSSHFIDKEVFSDKPSDLKLAPSMFVSLDEKIAYDLLDSVYHLDLEDDAERFGPLSARQWLRGYAVLKGWLTPNIDLAQDLSHITFTPAALVKTLIRAGLSEMESKAFIDLATLSKGRRDLFDAPLLQDEDGNLHLLRAVTFSAALFKIVSSQIASVSSSSQKGSRFESAVIDLFSSAGIPAKSVKYSEGDSDYQCDVLALWNNNLFVIECKNHVLPESSPARSFNFWQTLDQDADQLIRITKQISARPDLIKEAFGDDAKVERVHSILLNAMPFSVPGLLKGVFVYDYSALSRFFRNPFLTLMAPASLKDGSKILTEHRVKSLWGGEKPVPADLIAQMTYPIQFTSFKESWYVHIDLVPINDKLAVELPSLRVKELSLTDSLQMKGLTKEDIEAAQERAKQIVKALEKR